MKKHLKILFVLFMMLLLTATCISMRISAATLDENTTIGSTWSGVAWQLDGGTGELTISKSASGSGYMNPFSTSSTSAWRDYKSYIKTVIVEEGVTSVSSCAFYNCTNLTSVSLPSTVTLIGSRAFSGCTKLSEITVPSNVSSIGNYAFEDCTALSNIALSEGLTSIGDYAFDYCRGLTDIELPSSITSIGRYTFNYCTSLTSIEIPKNASIGYEAFYGCSNLVSATIHSTSGISYLPKGTLKTVDVRDVVSLPSNSFSNFTALERVSLPEGLTSIGLSAFKSCKSLKQINIPESVTSIGQHAFSGCQSLENIIIPESVTSIGYSAFSDCDALTSITIPASVTYFDNYVFWRCDNLTSVDFAEGSKLTSIGNTTFASCPKLVNVTLPKGITSLADSVFSGCSSLKEVIIPAGVKSISKNAFASCTSLEKIIYCGTEDLWNSITKDDAWAPPSTYTIQFHNYVNNVCSECGDDFPCDHADGFVGFCAICNRRVGTCGENLTWTLDENTGLLIIWGTGEMTHFTSTQEKPWNPYRSTIKTVVVKEGVTSVEQYAFAYCTNITNIVFPKSIECVAYNAFFGCSNVLQKEGGVSYAGNCVMGCDTTVTSVTLRDDVVAIANHAFSGCSKLTSITIPKSVVSIGQQAFDNCTSLSTVIFEEGSSLRTIRKFAFYDCPLESLTIPESLKNVEDDAFPSYINHIYVTDVSAYLNINGTMPRASEKLHILNSSGYELTYLYIYSAVNGIPDYAFYNATSLTDVKIYNGVTSIGKYAFYKCTNITNVAIPNSVTNIGMYAFHRSSGNITFTYCGTNAQWASVTRGDNWAIQNGNYNYIDPYVDYYHQYNSNGKCTVCNSGAEGECGENLVWKLEPSTGTLTISGTGVMYNYGSYPNYDAPWKRYSANIKAVIIENGVTSIGQRSFYECDSLTSLTIPDSVTSIENYAFYYCSNLTSVAIPDSVTVIKGSAFYHCSNLASLTLGDGVMSIGYDAFYLCSKLTSVTLPKSITNIDGYAFAACSSLKTMIYCGTNEGWSAVTKETYWNSGSSFAIQFHNCQDCVCVECGAEIHVWDEGIVTTEPTAETEGEMLFTCSLCDATKTEIIEKIHEHEWDDGVITTEPTHMTKGIKTFTCVCGETYTEVIDKLTEHTNIVDRLFDCYYENGQIQGAHWHVCECGTHILCDLPKLVSQKLPTHLETGYQYYECEICEDGTTVTLPKLPDHEWDDGVITTEPTPKTEGVKTFACSCGATYTETFTFTFYFTVSGSITSFGSETDAITVQLIPEGETEAAYTATATGNHTSYSIPDVAWDTYTLKISKANHLVAEKSVTILDGDVTENVALVLGSDGKQFKINSAYLVLSQDINVIYRTTVPSGFTDPRMVFEFNGDQIVVTAYTVDEQGRYCYAFPKVNPQKMGDNISATLYATVDGTEVSVSVPNYSVRQYCINQLSKNPDASLKRMISDLLVYGEKTQIYQNYKTDALVTDGLELTPSTFETLDASYNKLQLIGTADANIKYSSASLELSNDMIVLLGITATDPTPYTFEVTTNGETKVYSSEDLTYRNGKYYLSINGVKATKFNDVITAVIKKNGVQVGQTLQYSVNTYIQKNQGTANTALDDLLKAIYNYGESAKLYEQ